MKITIPPAITGQNRKNAEAAAAIFATYIPALDQAYAHPSSVDWDVVVRRYMAGPAAQTEISFGQQTRALGYRQIGITRVIANVVSATLVNVKISVCVDGSNIKFVDSAGKDRTLKTSRRTILKHFTIDRYAKPSPPWLINSISYDDPPKSC